MPRSTVRLNLKWKVVAILFPADGNSDKLSQVSLGWGKTISGMFFADRAVYSVQPNSSPGGRWSLIGRGFNCNLRLPSVGEKSRCILLVESRDEDVHRYIDCLR